MSIYDKYLLNKDKLLRRRIEVDDTLYNELKRLSKIYDASVARLIDIAILELLKSEKVVIYERAQNESVRPHNFALRETGYNGLIKLKDKYGISICKLINIAIYNTINN